MREIETWQEAMILDHDRIINGHTSRARKAF
jgi:hypothetical protein